MKPPFKYWFFNAGASLIDTPFGLFADKINQKFILSRPAGKQWKKWGEVAEVKKENAMDSGTLYPGPGRVAAYSRRAPL
jgi:hypothetical protein